MQKLLIIALLAVAAPAVAAPRVETALESPLPNVPGKQMTVITVSYGPGEGSGPHRHAPSAFIYVRVLAGHIRSQMEGEPAKTYGPGESWTEGLGAHHLLNANASATEPASMLVVFVADQGAELTKSDRSP